ncbi:hypothetical protein T07_11344 [Trichinella nelsoni]|uniref:Uncharacterized protein n=1 Tax=Trichinella nelsoni TaxID=6336 RepID=A0A0V0SLY5_9BILA|nr:hypothetical protein T07_11344 [Trichinella nelsoni]
MKAETLVNKVEVRRAKLQGMEVMAFRDNLLDLQLQLEEAHYYFNVSPDQAFDIPSVLTCLFTNHHMGAERRLRTNRFGGRVEVSGFPDADISEPDTERETKNKTITLQDILESTFLLGGHPIPQVFEMVRYLYFTDSSNAILDKIMLIMIIFTKSLSSLETFCQNCTAVENDEEQGIDEKVIPHKGKPRLKQYLPKKLNK